MYTQYLNQAKSTLNFMSSDELREFLNDEDKLDERVDEIVINQSRKSELKIIHIFSFCSS